MKVEFKQTIWESSTVDVTEEQKEVIIAAIKEGTISSSVDFHSFVEELTGKEPNWEMEYDSAEQLEPEDNGGFATIEIYEERHGPIIWDNALPDENNTEL